MSGEIKCPNCSFEFEPNEAIRAQVEKEANAKAAEWKKQKEEEYKKKEAELQLALSAQEKKIQQETEERLRKSLQTDFENQLKLLQEAAKEKDERLKLAREKELEYLKKEQALKAKEEELELQLQRKILEQSAAIKEQIRKEEEERIKLKDQEFELKRREFEKQIEDQKKLIEEMRRKSEQGSMQLQGEVQELMLEELLSQAFPTDKIEEVSKGKRGADCIQIVHTQFGMQAGKIIYESKRTKEFSNEWIDKLKTNMRAAGADVAVIVTQTMPKDMDKFGQKDGVYICQFSEVRSLALVLRDAILKVYHAIQSQENKGDKMHLLYNYLTSNEFGAYWKAISEGFLNIKHSIDRERAAMEKLWKAREKELEKVLQSAAAIKGSIEGIAGSAVNINLLGTEDDESLMLD